MMMIMIMMITMHHMVTVTVTVKVAAHSAFYSPRIVYNDCDMQTGSQLLTTPRSTL
jgi:hypothetical protein